MKGPGKIPEKFQGSAAGDGNQWGAAVFANLDTVADQIKSTRSKIIQAAQDAVRQHLSDPEIERRLAEDQLASREAKDAEREGAKNRFIKTDLLWLNQFTEADDDAVRKTINNGGRQLVRVLPFLSSACATLDSRAIESRWTVSEFENFLKFGTRPDRTFPEPSHSSQAAAFPFKPVTVGDPSLADGDAFYNAERQSYNAIAADLDIRRTIYVRTQPPGIASRLFFDDARSLDLVLITGPSGSGKSVLLDRIAHDAIQQEWSAYRCHGAQIANADGITGLLEALTASGINKILLLIDDANEALRRGLTLQHLSQFALGSPDTTIKIVLAANIDLLSADLRSTIPSVENVAIYSIAALDEDELHQLVDKLALAEGSGIIRRRRSSLTTQERLAILQLPRDRIIVIALLILRYGQSIREIIREEFVPLTSNTKRILRRCAVYAQFDTGFPAAKAAVLLQNPDSAPEFRHLTRQENGFYFVRHARLNQPTLDVALPEAQDRCDELISALCEANRWTGIDSAVLVKVFTAPRIAPRIKQLFKHNMDVVRTFVETMLNLSSEFVNGKYGALFLGFLGQIAKDGLSDYACAANLFEEARALDQDSAFIRRQLAWSYHKLGDKGALTTVARETLCDFPEAIDLRAECATLLARTVKADNIEIAFKEISALVNANPQDQKLRRQKEVIEQFERIRELQSTNCHWIVLPHVLGVTATNTTRDVSSEIYGTNCRDWEATSNLKTKSRL